MGSIWCYVSLFLSVWKLQICKLDLLKIGFENSWHAADLRCLCINFLWNKRAFRVLYSIHQKVRSEQLKIVLSF